MKHLPLIISIVALIGVVGLYFMQSKKEAKVAENSTIIPASSDSASALFSKINMAYIDVQRINSEYGYYKDLAAELENKQKRAEGEFRGKAEAFQREYEEFMNKAQKGSFISEASMQQQEMELRQKQQNLAQLEQDLTARLQGELQKLDAQATDTVMHYLKTFNKSAKYDMIINSVTLLEAGNVVNITDTILHILNTRYEATKVKK